MRCAAPTSARPGDRAIVLGDGTIEGFVGGSCADATVRLQALRALETGEPMLLRILPGEDDGPSDEDGAVVVANPCLSGGALELFLEPRLPPPRVAIAGESPVARALAELCEPLGLRGAARRDGRAGRLRRRRRVARARRRGRAAARARRGLRVRRARRLARARRGGARRAARGRACRGRLARVRTPAGVDIGARTHAEIALVDPGRARRASRAALPAAPSPRARARPSTALRRARPSPGRPSRRARPSTPCAA